MSTELIGFVGIALWVMVLVAQLRKRSTTGHSSRRDKLRNGRY